MKLALSLYMMIFLTYIESSLSGNFQETPLLEESDLDQIATEEDFEDRIAIGRKHVCTEEPTRKTFVIWPKSQKPNLAKAWLFSDVEKSTRCTTIFKMKGECKRLVLRCP